MEEGEPAISIRGSQKNVKMLLLGDTDPDDKGKEMGCTVKDIKQSCEISGPVGDPLTQECENMVDEEEDQALNSGDQNKKMHTATLCSQPEVEEEINFGSSTSVDNYSCNNNSSEENNDLQFSKIIESDDNIALRSMVKNVPNEKNDEAKNPSALEKEPAAVSKNIVVKHLHLASINIREYMRLIFLGAYMHWQIFPDCQINAAAMGTKSCTACFAICLMQLFFIHAKFCSRHMVRTSLLNTLMILSSCQLSRELLAIGASKDIDDNVCCVFCAEEETVKNADDLKNGQHLTRPGRSKYSWSFLALRISLNDLYKHHLFLKDIVVFPDKTVMLTLIHYTKCDSLIDIYETVEHYVPGENLNVVHYSSPMYSPEEINDRAESSVNFPRKAKPDCYNLFSYNCETLIREIMVGSKISLQVQNFFEIITNILMFIFWITSLFMSWYIGLFTIVAIFFKCILIYLAVDLSTRCKKDKIICGSHLNYIRIKIFSYVLDIGWIIFVYIIS